jgi:flagellar protein FlbD
MIQLTRLNNSLLTVNSDLIKFVEQSPDTVITLLNGEKILVRETADEIVLRTINFRRSVLQGISAITDSTALITHASREHQGSPSNEEDPKQQSER